MAAENIQDQNIGEIIKSNLLKTQSFVTSRKKVHSGLLIASMVFSGVSTLVAGITSAGGPIIGSGIEGWRLACIIAAIFGFSATISTGVIQQLDSTDRLSEGKACLSNSNRLIWQSHQAG